MRGKLLAVTVYKIKACNREVSGRVFCASACQVKLKYLQENPFLPPYLLSVGSRFALLRTPLVEAGVPQG